MSALEMPLNQIRFNIRSKQCFDRKGITTLGQLVQCSDSDLLKINCFGRATLKHVKEVLAAMGLKLGMTTRGNVEAVLQFDKDKSAGETAAALDKTLDARAEWRAAEKEVEAAKQAVKDAELRLSTARDVYEVAIITACESIRTTVALNTAPTTLLGTYKSYARNVEVKP